jgi:type II secretory pathway pseudopilin PulG
MVRLPTWVVALIVVGILAALISYAVNNLPTLKNPKRLRARVAVLVVFVLGAIGITAILSNQSQSVPVATEADAPGSTVQTEYEALSGDALWGPARDMLSAPASEGRLNCLSHDSFLNPESDFVWAKTIDDRQPMPWKGSDLAVEDGHIYTVAIYPVNCGKFSDGYRTNWLESVSLRIDIPRGASREQRLGAIVRSASTESVWDGVRFHSDRPFSIVPVPGSVQFMASGIAQSDERRLSDDVFRIAQLIGDSDTDGLLRPCAKNNDPSTVACHVLIYFNVQVEIQR